MLPGARRPLLSAARAWLAVAMVVIVRPMVTSHCPDGALPCRPAGGGPAGTCRWRALEGTSCSRELAGRPGSPHHHLALPGKPGTLELSEWAPDPHRPDDGPQIQPVEIVSEMPQYLRRGDLLGAVGRQ